MQEYAALYLQRQRLQQAAKHAERSRRIREALAARPKLSERVGVIIKDLRSGAESTRKIPRPA